MTILYPVPTPVKSSRPARLFGAGILAARPTYAAPYTAADEAWLIEDNARREDARFDAMAAESVALDALSRGLIPPDVAAALMATNLIGHDA